MNKIYEAQLDTGGLPQQDAGFGKSRHTISPDPITWENLSELEHYVTALPDGTFLAGLSLPNSTMATPTFKFNNEEEALHWIRKEVESFTIKRANQEL
jgi:plastocyanin